MQPIRYTIICLSVVLLFLAGCGKPQVNVQPISASASPKEQINELSKGIQEAKGKGHDILAPKSFDAAELFLKRAQSNFKNKASSQKVLNEVAQGKAYLKKASDVSIKVQTTLPDVVNARRLAREAGATLFANEYEDVEEDFLDLTKAIEGGNTKKAKKNSKKVIAAFSALELKAIKEKTLGQVRSILSEAEKKQAKKYAPKTLATARKALREADQFISKQRYNKEEMRKKAEKALFQAQRLLNLTAVSKKLEDMEPENIAIWAENFLVQPTLKLGAQDMRNEEFRVQVSNILASIQSQQDDISFLRDKVKGLTSDLQAANTQVKYYQGLSEEGREAAAKLSKEKQSAKARLEAEKKFQEQFVEVQKIFNSQEAEVYKQGQRLLIRLKAIQFPVGKYVIMPDNYALLTKVRQAISIFGEPNVTVEGHTDSTGSDALNKHLSTKRAEAVREYFIANKALPAQKIVAIGYGPEKPLASNKTAKGRAINRRIDVTIMTQRPAN